MRILVVLIAVGVLLAGSAMADTLLVSKDIPACESLENFRILQQQGKKSLPVSNMCITIYKGTSVEVIGATDDYIMFRLGGIRYYGPQVPLIRN